MKIFIFLFLTALFNTAMASDGFELKHLAPADADYEYSTQIKVAPYKGEDCEGCFTISYFGPLYKGCSATGACMPQNYQVVMDKTGQIINNEKTAAATKNGLKKYDPTAKGQHSSLSAIEFARLVAMANNPKDIEDIYGITSTQKDSYAGKISKAKETVAHGNTAATFMTHITMARRELINTKKISGNWADYSGIYPGYDVAKKGERIGVDEKKIIDTNVPKDILFEGKKASIPLSGQER